MPVIIGLHDPLKSAIERVQVFLQRLALGMIRRGCDKPQELVQIVKRVFDGKPSAGRWSDVKACGEIWTGERVVEY